MEEWKKIFKFVIVGCCSTGIDFVFYMIFSLSFSIILAKGMSMIISSIFSYTANKIFTFKNKNKTNMRYLLRFYLVFITNLCINISVNYLVYTLCGNKLLAYMIATFCGMMVNYIGQRVFVF
jgi:putative flippase GtrA